jgi:putative membrane protein
MMNQFGNHGWAMGWGWIIGLILLIIIIWVIVRTFNQGKMNQSESKSALDILKERYAKGEIDKEEFEKRKIDLM